MGSGMRGLINSLLLVAVGLPLLWAVSVGQERTERLERDQMRLELLREMEGRY